MKTGIAFSQDCTKWFFDIKSRDFDMITKDAQRLVGRLNKPYNS